MTYAKKELFDHELQELSLIFKAMSHPARLAILKYLAECENCVSGDISKKIPLSRSTVSQHLQELKTAGLIQGNIDGVKINYCIKTDKINIIRTLIHEYLSKISTDKKYNCTNN